MGRIRVETPSGAAYAENWSGDENVFNSGATHLRGGSSTQLKRWQALQAMRGSGNDDARSVADRIIFADESNNMDNPLSFRRAPSSPLFGVAGPDISTWRRWADAGEGPW